jgi:hypothetical protein
MFRGPLELLDQSEYDDIARGHIYTVPKKHHQNVHAAIEAAQSGCYLCNQLIRSQHRVSPAITITDLDTNRELYYYLEFDGNDRPKHVHLSDSRAVLSGYNFITTLALVAVEPDSDFPGFDTQQETSTGSIHTRNVIETWMGNCRQSHTICNERRINWSPRRLIKIHPSGTTVRVIAPEENDTIKYTALSHRWGGAANPALTETTAFLSTDIETASLPKTWREAIDITLHIGLYYIWIDSLCIIQGNQDDWRQESGKMHLIYGNAEATLAATATYNSSGGLFYDRTPEHIKPHIVTAHWSSDNPLQLLLFPFHLWDDDIDCQPLNSRGWVLQERLLSRRIIHFSDQQVFWECRVDMACETLPVLPRDQKIKDRLHFGGFQPLKFWFKPEESRSMDLDTALQAWYNAMTRYTICGLTRISDRLPAIAGLAKLHAAQNDDEYLAGLWGHNMVMQLEWWLQEPCEGSEESVYLAPSWSWISVPPQPSGIQFVFKKQVVPMAKISNVSLQHVSDVFGEVEAGRFLLQGLLIDVLITEWDRVGEISGMETHGRAWVDRWQTVQQLPQMVTWVPLRDDPVNDEYTGLLLHVVEESSILPVYRRVGVLEVDYADIPSAVQAQIDDHEEYWKDIVIV